MGVRSSDDPCEKLIRQALADRGIVFVEEDHPLSKNLDFYLVEEDIHIEVKQFFTPRIAAQMERAHNVVAVQGMDAARWLADIIRGYP